MRPEVIVALLILVLTPALVWVTGIGAHEETESVEVEAPATPATTTP